MAKRPRSVSKVGAVLTFPEGVTEAQVRAFLEEWRGELEKDASEFAFDSIQTGSFNPDWGGPVFYVP
jgi:hypothetical protein